MAEKKGPSICRHCKQQLNPDRLYCRRCGGVNGIAWQQKKYAWYSLLLYYGVSFLLVALYQYSGLFRETYSSLIAFDAIISLFTLGFVYERWAQIKPLLRFEQVQWKQLLLLCAMIIALGVLVSWTADILNESIYHRKHQVSFIFWETSYPRLLTIIFICMQPAIIEELAYRGLVFHYLQQITKKSQWAIIGSAAMFSALHFSLLGWLWLMPLAILLAYYRWKYNTLWYGILGHFLYNLVIVWWEW